MVNDKILYDLDDNFGHWWECGFSAPTMTKNLYPYTKMFSPIKVNKLTIKNRLVMGPMGNIDIDLAIPVVKKSYDETEIFRLNFGARL